MIVDFSDLRVFCISTVIMVLLIICSIKTKKSFIACISLITYIVVLAISVFSNMSFVNRTIHFVVNFIGIIASIITYILIDDIETRRKIVTKVFKNRYKKK